MRSPGGPNYLRLKRLMRSQSLHTVCEEAGCPNIGECWEAGTATFMILGDVCTRACKYCAVAHGMPTELDLDEPRRVADTIVAMALDHVVITSVNRDELRDGGASIYAATIREVRARLPECSVEVLIPDFKGDEDALRAVMEARPAILGHNLETVERLHPEVRPGGRYWRSISYLGSAKRIDPSMLTKTGIILGMGEEEHEIRQAMADPAGSRGGHSDAGTVPAPVPAAHSGGPLGDPRRVPRVEADRRGGIRLPPCGVRAAGPLQLPREGAGARSRGGRARNDPQCDGSGHSGARGGGRAGWPDGARGPTSHSGARGRSGPTSHSRRPRHPRPSCSSPWTVSRSGVPGTGG